MHTPQLSIEVPIVATCAPFAFTDAQVAAFELVTLPSSAAPADIPASLNRVADVQPQFWLPAKGEQYVLHLHDDKWGVQLDLLARGPLHATMNVTAAVCKYWSTLLIKAEADAEAEVKPFVQERSKDKVCTVPVGLVGWTADECWLVCPGWTLVCHADKLTCFKLKMADTVTLCPWVTGVLSLPPTPPPADTVTMTVRARRVPASAATSALGGNQVAVKGKVKVKAKQVKAKVTLGHGANKAAESSKPALHTLKERVSAGDIASITFMGITCAAIAVVLVMLFSRWLHSKKNKGQRSKKMKACKVNV